ncbi:MAG: CHASE3 domain-containing protein [Caulobacteraceae bacterium]
MERAASASLTSALAAGQADDLLTQVLEQTNALRGYVIKGEPKFLTTYQEADATFDKTLAAMGRPGRGRRPEGAHGQDADGHGRLARAHRRQGGGPDGRSGAPRRGRRPVGGQEPDWHPRHPEGHPRGRPADRPGRPGPSASGRCGSPICGWRWAG